LISLLTTRGAARTNPESTSLNLNVKPADLSVKFVILNFRFVDVSFVHP